ncbi:MAG TPA: 3'-5' exonuclease [Nitrospirota bacterium]|nr:3'-5' exonuclease [Nitrospirota bacterium]
MFGLFGSRKSAERRIAEKTPIAAASYAVVDTELTGLDDKKDSIVSVGAVRIDRGCIHLGNSFYRLVSPRTELSAESVVIHEIMPCEVANEPGIDTVLGDFLDFCGDAVIVGHFVAIDIGFLNRELKRTNRPAISNPVLDTFSIYEWLRKRGKTGNCPSTLFSGYQLYELVSYFGIAVNGAHNALMDAYITAQLLQRFFPLLVEAGAKDVGDLITIGTPFRGGDRFGLLGEFGNF